MKRIIFTLNMFLLLTGFVKAQQLNNSGFESWDTLGDYTQPTSWFSLNPLVQFGFDPTTLITADAHSGNYAVRLESKSNPFSDISGVLCTGPILNSQQQPDFSNMKIAFTGKPVSFEFYYKAKPMPQDTCVIGIYFTKWNATTKQSDTIGGTGTKVYDSTNVYKLATLPIEYYTQTQPDSMFLIASSSIDGYNPVVGSYFILDDFHLTYNATGLREETQSTFSSYPNPANNSVELSFEKPFIGEVKLYDITGKQLHQQKVSGIKMLLSLDTYSSGVYFIVIQDEAGNKSSQKLLIQH